MAGFGRSFKPPSYLSSMSMTARRPPMPGRSISNSSDVSPMGSRPTSPEMRPDDVVFSARPSPTSSPMDSQPSQFPRSPSGHLRPGTSNTTAHSPSRSPVIDSSLLDPPRSPAARSRPIAIEFPTSKTANSGPVYTPPAPLSARGDLPGGYFPLHEDQTRVYRPHPFQLDASKARIRSLQVAGSSHSESQPETPEVTAPIPPPVTAPTAVAERPSPKLQMPGPSSKASSSRRGDSRSSTPVTSFNPTPYQENPIPMGKYYPSNYEQRKAEKHRSKTSDSVLLSSTPPMDLSGATSRQSQAMHTRNESEAKRRLQQYQRDMIAQASLALDGGNFNSAALQSLRNIGFASISKPNKPKLEPLGSPGPVTPMELGGSADGYLSARGPADDAQAEEIARAMRAEHERRRREGQGSPVVELGRLGY